MVKSVFIWASLVVCHKLVLGSCTRGFSQTTSTACQNMLVSCRWSQSVKPAAHWSTVRKFASTPMHLLSCALDAFENDRKVHHRFYPRICAFKMSRPITMKVQPCWADVLQLSSHYIGHNTCTQPLRVAEECFTIQTTSRILTSVAMQLQNAATLGGSVHTIQLKLYLTKSPGTARYFVKSRIL